MSESATKTSPSEAELQAAVLKVQEEHPDVGTTKIYAALLASNPSWIVSEKRLRKFLRVQRGDEPPPPPPAAAPSPTPTPGAPKAHHPRTRKKGKTAPEKEESAFPVSHLIEGLNVEELTKKVRVHVFDEVRGKGLVATESIKEGEVIWKEDPCVYSPAWPIQDAQSNGQRCAFCAHSLPTSRSPPIPCPDGCGVAWCNRLCAARAKAAHGFLCTSQNPACIPLMRFIRGEQWIALGAWARVAALLLGDGTGWEVLHGLAAMSLRERVKILPNWQATSLTNEQLWKKAHGLYVEAFDAPSDPILAKKLAKLRKSKKLTPEQHTELFSFDGFLLGLGKMSLNVEAHGAIYRLHSHLNHSCDPNASVRHPEGPQMPGKVVIIAKRDIAEGEELVVSYVDPSSSVAKRRRELREWGFGECSCERCRKEEKEAPEEAGGKGDLEEELRGFLGV